MVGCSVGFGAAAGELIGATGAVCGVGAIGCLVGFRDGVRILGAGIGVSIVRVTGRGVAGIGLIGDGVGIGLGKAIGDSVGFTGGLCGGKVAIICGFGVGISVSIGVDRDGTVVKTRASISDGANEYFEITPIEIISDFFASSVGLGEALTTLTTTELSRKSASSIAEGVCAEHVAAVSASPSRTQEREHAILVILRGDGRTC